jgi:hypothetical protein
MLRKKEVYTIVTPIPGFIPRQLAIDILHSHSEVITLNPLVLSHKPIPAPRGAASDEFYSTWYEITERIQYIPGMGKMGSGKISFNGCFHDMPWGLQTHIYAPMNLDLRNKYRIGGNQPGVEPPEPPEIGAADLGVPSDGLYLREDIEIKCNIAMMSFVKSQLKTATKEMVQRIIKKAELLDAGVLSAMIEDGKLKTFNPNDRSNRTSTMGVNRTPSAAPSHFSTGSAGGGPPPSPGLTYHGSVGHGHAPVGYYTGMQQQQQHHLQASSQGGHAMMAYPQAQQIKPPEPQGPIEMEGDLYHPQTSPSFAPAAQQNHQSPQQSPTFAPPRSSHGPAGHRNSEYSNASRSSYVSASPQPPQQLQQHPGQPVQQPTDPRWGAMQVSQMESRGSIAQTPAEYRSPPIDQKEWEAGQYEGRQEQGDGRGAPPPYNPQAYANMR